MFFFKSQSGKNDKLSYYGRSSLKVSSADDVQRGHKKTNTVYSDVRTKQIHTVVAIYPVESAAFGGRNTNQ